MKRKARGSIVKYVGKNSTTYRAVYYAQGKTVWTTHATKEDAERFLDGTLGRKAEWEDLPVGGMLVRDLLNRWFTKEVELDTRPSTAHSYRTILDAHLLPALGDIKLTRLSPSAIENYRDEKLSSLSPRTVQYHRILLHAAMQYALRHSLITRNPVDFVTAPKVERPEVITWDEENARRFLDIARGPEASRQEGTWANPYYPLFALAIYSGMRQGELLGLRWSDIDWKNNRVAVRQTLVRLDKGFSFGKPKSKAGDRHVSLPVYIMDLLREVQTAQAKDREKWGEHYEDHGLVFAQPDGKPHHAHNIVNRDFYGLIAAYNEKAKEIGAPLLPKITFHSLRHAHATMLLRKNVHPKVVQERLGHSKIGLTLDTYSHVTRGMQETALAALPTL